MYWKVEEYEDEKGEIWLIYNFFHTITTVNHKPPYFNPRTKTYIFYPAKQITIRSGIFDSEEHFLTWWEENKSL